MPVSVACGLVTALGRKRRRRAAGRDGRRSPRALLTLPGPRPLGARAQHTMAAAPGIDPQTTSRYPVELRAGKHPTSQPAFRFLSSAFPFLSLTPRAFRSRRTARLLPGQSPSLPRLICLRNYCSGGGGVCYDDDVLSIYVILFVYNSRKLRY